MKRIGILSDTHGCMDPKFAVHFAQCDEIWHAGDVGDPAVLRYLESIRPGMVVRAVAGNIDGQPMRRICGEWAAFTVEDVRVVMTHISGYPGKWAAGVRPVIRKERARITVGGHSHILRVVYDPELDTLHINPGAAGHHGWQKVRTLVRLTIDGADIKDLEVIELGQRGTVC